MTSDRPLIMAAMPSGWLIETVSGVELAVLARPEGLLGRHLEGDGLDRDLHGRQRDAVLLGEVLDGLHVGVDGGEADAASS